MLVSVPQAAEQLELDVGRVRRLVASGVLAGQKVGGRWLIEDAAVAERLASRRRAGRPLSQRSAWGCFGRPMVSRCRGSHRERSPAPSNEPGTGRLMIGRGPAGIEPLLIAYVRIPR